MTGIKPSAVLSPITTAIFKPGYSLIALMMESERPLSDFRPRLSDQLFINDLVSAQAMDYLNLYRCFIAVLFAGLLFTPILADAISTEARQWGQVITWAFIFFAPVQLYLGRTRTGALLFRSSVGFAFDIVGTMLMMTALGGLESGMGTLLVGSTAVGGVVFQLRVGLSVAGLAAMVLLWQTMARVIEGTEAFASLAPAGSLGATYFVTALLGHYLARRSRESQQLAVQQSMDLAQLSRLNQLVVARMRTGIVIADHQEGCRVMNDAAWYLMGMPPSRVGELVELAPEVLDNLRHWQQTGRHRNESLTLANGVPAVVPRFARLSAHDHSETLIFLEDSSIVSRRAQELTLSSLGRLSATIAHEIRNPLAAISHSGQLLAESTDLVSGDRRLTDIILRHCRRMNDIIENVLQLARQESPKPETVLLGDWLEIFAFELRRDHEIGENTVEVRTDDMELTALVDPSQLQQVLWNLCQNAFRYGHPADQPAQVILTTRSSDALLSPVIEVSDNGPGVPADQQAKIFEPFFTTASDGTGLGLYLCQQICASNQAILEYCPGPDGRGSVFKISLQRPPGADLDA